MFVRCCCNLMMVYDWRECVTSVLSTTKHSQCDCIGTWQQSCIVFMIKTVLSATLLCLVPCVNSEEVCWLKVFCLRRSFEHIPSWPTCHWTIKVFCLRRSFEHIPSWPTCHWTIKVFCLRRSFEHIPSWPTCHWTIGRC